MTVKYHHSGLFPYLVFLLVLLTCSAAGASVLPAGFAENTVVSGLSSPTAMEFAPDGRIFVCQQGGSLRVIKSGALLPTPFLTVTVNSSGERGLLGIAFDPNFASNNFVYIYYTATTPAIHNRISRFTANGDVAVAGSEVILLDLDNLSGATNHNGGAIHFGPDGKLYSAVGENATGSNAQSFANLLGKMLRINKDGTIPADNPFLAQTSGKNQAIWAMGLRNPFTFAFQPGTGRMLINDVGQNTWEEINDGIVASNYGWPNAEGSASCATYRCPLFAYGHGSGSTLGCAITGGTFYNPTTVQFPSSYVGKYFFADYCSNWIRLFDPATNTATGFATSIAGSTVDLKTSTDGSLYYIARSGDMLQRITYTANQAPGITTHPSNKTVPVGASATFTVVASGTPPLSYQWERNHVNISGATSTSYTLTNAQLSDSGALFRCVVTNDFGNATSNDATLTVTPNNPPTGTIDTPVAGTLYSGGETINTSGTGTDPEDVTIPAGGFTWQVDLHHDLHTHPFVPPTTGSKTGSFTIPVTGETVDNQWYRIYLTVMDSGGLTHTSYREIFPRKATVTLASNPTALQVKLDGAPVTAPYSFVGVVGMQRTIEAVSPQTAGATTYNFTSWSDGGAISHTISTPSSNTTYTATFSAVAPNGDGLTGTYFDNKDLTNQKLIRVDPTVNFNWGKGSPAAGIAADTFSVRWTGKVQPQFTETYTFRANVNDGVRLYVNGQLIINAWVNNAGQRTGTIALTGGQKYTITMEYFENRSTAGAILSWSSPSQAIQVIPKLRLYSQ